jgi:hypothetical protein
MLAIRINAERLAIVKLDANAPWPRGAGGPFYSVTRTETELSIVCSANDVPPQHTAVAVGWRALELVGPWDLDAVGVLASVLEPLAAARVAIFAASTHDTDYVLVREEQLDTARQALAAEGFAVEGLTGD